jgi:hypothetical protein
MPSAGFSWASGGIFLSSGGGADGKEYDDAIRIISV